MPSADENISYRAYVATGIVLASFAGIFVAARIAISLRNKRKLRIDDVISVFAIITFAGLIAISAVVIDTFNNPTVGPDYNRRVLRVIVALSWISSSALWCSKAPVLFMFVTLFGVKSFLRFACYAMLLALALGVTISTSLITAVCNPNVEVATPKYLLHCNSVGLVAGLAVSFLSVVIDVIMIVLPINVVWHLNLSTHKKVGLAIMFGSGILATAASIVALSFRYKSRLGSPVSITDGLIGTLVEICLAIVVGSLPPTYSLWRHILETGISARLRGTFFSSYQPDEIRKSQRSGPSFGRYARQRPSTSVSSAMNLRDGSTHTTSTEHVAGLFENCDTLPVPSKVWNSPSTAIPLQNIERK
ncbi:hypothetical protein F4777DRAFT_575771 [Nemania sp. FL0916]|nr:hypothetical protein F4777DRAFT_575771 [Nemania sp. FL0916]